MTARETVAQARREVDRKAADFFNAVSFEAGELPRFDALHGLFIGRGLLINNSAEATVVFTVDEFIGSRRAGFSADAVSRYRVTELSQTTEVFGGIAHRASGFVRSGVKAGQAFEVRGMIFMQFVQTPAGWRISAAAWDDQRPGQTLSGHAEPTEFGAG
ncbi:MAG: hypothetical protein OEY03_16585 [Rhizobacter sp.]|nr:hypothetical protein [Rhizobacter sp.]